MPTAICWHSIRTTANCFGDTRWARLCMGLPADIYARRAPARVWSRRHPPHGVGVAALAAGFERFPNGPALRAVRCLLQVAFQLVDDFVRVRLRINLRKKQMK